MQPPKIKLEIDRVHNNGLYITTVSIKHKAVDRIKTVSGMIPVTVDKINKMVQCGFPHLEVNEAGFAGFLQQQLQYKINNYPLTKNKPIYHTLNVNR